ncbi:MAG: hypothetical protein K2K52_08455, partial [Paramuribaculum sp.]|nr:hypothetical protein [Paramuribaculum sp.]
VRLLHTTQLNGFHDELYSLNLYFQLKKEFENCHTFYYRSVKSSHQDAGISIKRKDNPEGEPIVVTYWDNEWRFLYPDTDNWVGDKIENKDRTSEEIYAIVKGLVLDNS